MQWSAKAPRRTLAPPRPGRPSPLASGRSKSWILVDDVERGLERLLRIVADLGAGAGLADRSRRSPLHDVCARAASGHQRGSGGNSSNTSRRVIVVAKSPVIEFLHVSNETIGKQRKA